MEGREVRLNPHFIHYTKRCEPDDDILIIKGIHKNNLCVPFMHYTKMFSLIMTY